MKLADVALVLGHAGHGRALALASLARAFGADAVSAALARGVAHRSGRWPVLELGAASRIRAAAYACYRDAGTSELLSPAAALGLTEYAYFGRDSFEPYRVLGAPLPAPVPGARPDLERPWVLVQARSTVDALAHLGEAGLRDVQLHTLLPGGALGSGRTKDVVRWLELPATTAAVLGRSYAVIADDGPLLWDAIRLDRKAIAASHVDVDERDLRLAGTLPPILLGDGRTLPELIAAGPEGYARWVLDLEHRREAIERRLGEPVEQQLDLERAKRRWQKLTKQPQRFLNESRSPALRRAGRWLERTGILARGK